jgi:hypothetical protein
MSSFASFCPHTPTVTLCLHRRFDGRDENPDFFSSAIFVN